MNNQFLISQELLKALKWIIENDMETLQTLVDNYINNTYNSSKEIDISNYSEEDQHNIIIDFFMLLEDKVIQAHQVNQINNNMQKKLIPAINNLDTISEDGFDDFIIAKSAQKARLNYENNPDIDPKSVLCKELLKRWKPSKKISIN